MKSGVRRFVIWPLCLIILVSMPAAAFARGAPDDAIMAAARLAYEQGDFLAAADMAREVENAEAYALAARATIAQGQLREVGAARLAYFVQAKEDARYALLLDPDTVEGRLQLAVALGFIAREQGVMQAYEAGYAVEARKLIDEALRLAPEDPWAHAASGGWNLEIVGAGGALGAFMLGASVEAGRAEYREALTLSPGNILIAYQYALQLAALGSGEAQAEARTVLADRDVGQAEDAASRETAQLATELAVILESGDRDRIEATARRLMGLPERTGPVARPGQATGTERLRPPIGSPR